MARMARTISSTGVYHIILRGINKERIFITEYDREKLIKELKRTKEKFHYSILAYCLMDNHIHLLVKDNENNLSKAIQSFAVAYALYFNKRYNRIGHLFQNRYHSRCVESENYLLNVQRYIHRNPEKAGIAKTEQYHWSSYSEYIGQEEISDTKLILDIFGDNRKEAKKNFAIFNTKNCVENELCQYMEFEIMNKLEDNEAKELIEKYLEIDNIEEIKDYNKTIIGNTLKKLKGIKGISVRQISRITNIDLKMVQRLLE